jgi:hypothetical protein
MICFAKPRLTEEIYKGRVFNIMLYVQYVRYVCLTKVKHIHMIQTNPPVRGDFAPKKPLWS